MSEYTHRETNKFVVYLNDGGEWVGTHGGPYTPSKAREVRQSMENHIERGNHRSWSIPKSAKAVKCVSVTELRDLKSRSLSFEDYFSPEADS